MDYYPDRMNIERHPVARLARNIERVEKLELNRRLGKAPPKKGQGKRATVAANKKKCAPAISLENVMYSLVLSIVGRILVP